MKAEGSVWKFGDNVDTDMIIPARYLNVWEPKELARYCFVDMRPEFRDGVKQGDIVVGGSNFGCGSSREHAPSALKGAGVAAVVAKSFARIFYRNAFNIGLPILECTVAADALQEGEGVSIDFASGEITHGASGKRFHSKPIPDFMREIIQADGLVRYIKQGKGKVKDERSKVKG